MDVEETDFDSLLAWVEGGKGVPSIARPRLSDPFLTGRRRRVIPWLYRMLALPHRDHGLAGMSPATDASTGRWRPILRCTCHASSTLAFDSAFRKNWLCQRSLFQAKTNRRPDPIRLSGPPAARGSRRASA